MSARVAFADMNFVFYDTETTGTHKAFDQILQFGAIRTDSDLNEIDRFEIRCRLLPYVVPAPGALRVTGVTVEQLTDPGLPSHYEMVCAIGQKLTSWSPATFIGHNSIDFDENLLRQAFYKSLHPPYLTQTSGNSRTDTLRILRAMHQLAPHSFAVPRDDRGKSSFKLDRLAPANGFDHRAAHDAMGDVEATIHMCRIIKDRSPEHWLRFINLAAKSTALAFTDEHPVFAAFDLMYGRLISRFLTTLAPNPDYAAELLAFNLAVDPDDLIDLPDDALSERLAASPRPVTRLRCNAAPMLVPYEATPQTMREGAPDQAELERRAARLAGDHALRDRLVKVYLATKEPFSPSSHVEEQIYDGFASRDDEARMTAFHVADWPGRWTLTGQFTDERYRALARRIVYTDAPAHVPDQAREEFERAVAARLLADEAPWLTFTKAIQDADDLLANAAGHERALLEEVRRYLARQAEIMAGRLA